jgi:hypothetical protein
LWDDALGWVLAKKPAPWRALSRTAVWQATPAAVLGYLASPGNLPQLGNRPGQRRFL